MRGSYFAWCIMCYKMITIFPIREKDKLENARRRLKCIADVILEARDGDDELGYICFMLESDAVDITGIFVNQPFVADGLIRSAVSYAIQREIPVATASAEGFDAQLGAVGFIRKDGRLFLRLETFMGKCQHGIE